MIKCYYINLDRSEWRRHHMEEMTQAAGLNFLRVSAVDGQRLSNSDFDEFHPLRPNMRRMTKSEVACFLSHRKAWEAIYKSKEEYGAVFEDDILFGKALSGIILEDGWVSQNMDLIKLDKATRKNVELGERVAINCRVEARRLLSLHIGCGGYIISRKLAERLIEESQTIHVPVDHFLFNPNEIIFKEYRVWQVVPSVCLHQQFSKDHFLPNSAEVSSLQRDRKETIKSHQKRAGTVKYVLAKLFRELMRPFIMFRNSSYMTLSCFLKGSSWKRITFLKD